MSSGEVANTISAGISSRLELTIGTSFRAAATAASLQTPNKSNLMPAAAKSASRLRLRNCVKGIASNLSTYEWCGIARLAAPPLNALQFLHGLETLERFDLVYPLHHIRDVLLWLAERLAAPSEFAGSDRRAECARRDRSHASGPGRSPAYEPCNEPKEQLTTLADALRPSAVADCR